MATQTTTPTPENALSSNELPQVKESGNLASVEATKSPEKIVEIIEPQKEKAPAVAPAVQSVSQAKDSPSPVAVKSEDLQQIEKILSVGLDDLYQSLSEIRKSEFKQKGEETARAVERLMKSAKIKVGKIVKLIVDWLKMIPGVNKFFLEQESKIKADRLLEYKQDKEEGKI